jgi:hypothetical protein
VEKAGLPGRFGVYAVASECLDADTLFTVDGLDYRFEFAWMDLGSVLHPDSTSFRPLDMDVIDPLARLYGSATTLNIGPVLDSLANAVDGLVADSLRLVFAWEAKDASPQINVGSGMEEIAVGTVLGDIGASLHAVNPAIQLDVLPGAFAGREHFYLIEASSAMTRVPGGRAMLDPLRGTPDPASSGLVAAGAWCHVGWTGETARIPFRLHLPVTSAKNAAVYRLNDGAWERIGGDTSNGEIVALISRGGLYRVFEGPAAGPVAARSMLDQNVPNPFNPVTVIQYRLPEPAQVTLGVYDVGGRLVRMLEQGFRDAGEASVVWRGDDDAGNEVASGVYFYRLQVSGGREESRKMVLMR